MYHFQHFVYSLLSFRFLFYHRSKVLPGGVQLHTVFLFIPYYCNKESFCKMDSLFPEIGQQLSRLTLSYAEA